MMGSSIVRASLLRQTAPFPTLPLYPGDFQKLVSCSQSSKLGNIESWRVAINSTCVRERVRKHDMATRAGADPPPPTDTVVPPAAPKVKCLVPKMSFCPSCGGAVEQRVPTGEHELRNVCTICGGIHYQNPKMVVGCLVEHEGKILLCKRSIQPSCGLWTLPAGYMELGESAAEGAARETWEEALAEVEVTSLFAHLDIPLIGQSYIIFRAKLKHPTFSPGPESLECALFRLEDIPFDMLAFSSIQVALRLYVEDVASGHLRVHHGVIDKRPGASPSDPVGYEVRNHISNL